MQRRTSNFDCLVCPPPPLKPSEDVCHAIPLPVMSLSVCYWPGLVIKARPSESVALTASQHSTFPQPQSATIAQSSTPPGNIACYRLTHSTHTDLAFGSMSPFAWTSCQSYEFRLSSLRNGEAIWDGWPRSVSIVDANRPFSAVST